MKRQLLILFSLALLSSSCLMLKSTFTIGKGFYAVEKFYISDTPRYSIKHVLIVSKSDSLQEFNLVKMTNKALKSRFKNSKMNFVNQPDPTTYSIVPVYTFEERLITKKVSDTIAGKYQEEYIPIKQLVGNITFDIRKGGDLIENSKVNPSIDEELKVRGKQNVIYSLLGGNTEVWESTPIHGFQVKHMGYNISKSSEELATPLYNEIGDKMLKIYRKKLELK